MKSTPDSRIAILPWHFVSIFSTYARTGQMRRRSVNSLDLFVVSTPTFTEPIRDPLWGNIFLSPAPRAARRLRSLRQAGPDQAAWSGLPGLSGRDRIRAARIPSASSTWPGASPAALAAKGQLDFCTREGLQSYLRRGALSRSRAFPLCPFAKRASASEHEALTARQLLSSPLRELASEAGADPEVAAAIVDKSRPDRGDRELRFFRGLLSGVLDPDKLDYLNRDAFSCGVPYGLQDCDFVLQRVAVGPGDASPSRSGGS